MIGAVLDVVEFHDELPTMNAVIVVTATVQRTGPYQSVVIQPGVANPGHSVGGHRLRHTTDILRDKGHQHLFLRTVQVTRRQTFIVVYGLLTAVVAQDVPRRIVMDNCLAPLAGVQRCHQFNGQVFALAQNPLTQFRPFPHLGGVRAQEKRRDGQYLVAPNAVMYGEMVAFGAPTPGV